jgi:hypothetical protein
MRGANLGCLRSWARIHEQTSRWPWSKVKTNHATPTRVPQQARTGTNHFVWGEPQPWSEVWSQIAPLFASGKHSGTNSLIMAKTTWRNRTRTPKMRAENEKDFQIQQRHHEEWNQRTQIQRHHELPYPHTDSRTQATTVKTRAEKKNSDSETHTQALTNRERSLRILGAVTKTGRRLHGAKKPATPEQSGRHQRLAEAKTRTLTKTRTAQI